MGPAVTAVGDAPICPECGAPGMNLVDGAPRPDGFRPVSPGAIVAVETTRDGRLDFKPQCRCPNGHEWNVVGFKPAQDERSTLAKNASEFVQKRYPTTVVVMDRAKLVTSNGETFEEYIAVAQDHTSGVKHRVVVIPDLGRRLELVEPLVVAMCQMTHELDKLIPVRRANNASDQSIWTGEMPFAPKIIIYTNRAFVPHDQVILSLNGSDLVVEIVDEAQMYNSLFVSYGGPDEAAAAAINSYLKGKGVSTWFFQEDALPGEKLHRLMHDEINKHDRVLLICSKAALSRPGVLNEIERVLEREAREGGREILIPIALDDYVKSEWAPGRPDLAAQIRTRVIATIDMSCGVSGPRAQLDKLVKALLRT
jgi:hypothetical protein